MLCLAGCSSGRRDCARGVWRRGVDGSMGMFYGRITSAVCRMALNRMACGMLRSYSAVGRDRRSCVLESLVRLLRIVGLVWACAFPYGNPDGGRRTGPAARRKCAFAQTHWLSHVFRREYVGGCAPPSLRQRVFDSLDSLHLIRGVGAFHAAKGLSGTTKTCPAPINGGRTAPRRLVSLDSLHLIRGVGAFGTAKAARGQRRLARLQPMVGQVV